MLYESFFRKVVKNKLSEAAYDPGEDTHAWAVDKKIAQLEKDGHKVDGAVYHDDGDSRGWRTATIHYKHGKTGKDREFKVSTRNFNFRKGKPFNEEIHPSKSKIPPASLTGRAKYIKKKSRSLGRAVYGRYHEEKKVNLKKGQSHVTINPTLDDKPVL